MHKVDIKRARPRVALLLGLAVGSAAARSIRSDQDLKFFEITSYDRPASYLGFTSSKLDNFVRVPSGSSWFVRPDGRMTDEMYGKLIAEIKSKPYPGLDVSDRWDITNPVLAQLAKTSSLRILRLANTKINDAGLAVLADLPNLEVLSLSNQISDNGLKQVKVLKRLKMLELHRAKVSDRGLATLKELPKLESLDLSDSKITDAGARILASFPALKQLDISGTLITDKGIALLAKLPKLEILYAPDTLSDGGLRALVEAKHLKTLDMSGSRVTDSGLKVLGKAAGLEALALSDVRVGDSGMPFVATLKRLKTLELSGTQVTRDGLMALAGMPRLETISLGWNELNGPEIRALSALPRLNRIVLNGRTLGQDVLARIKVLAKKTQLAQPYEAPANKKITVGMAPASHPGSRVTALPPQTLNPKTGVVSKPTYNPAMMPKDLPSATLASKPRAVVESTTPRGPGMIIEVAAAPEPTRPGRRRLTGLKRLHQLEITQAPRDMALEPGASPNIQSNEYDPANSLGEFTVNSR